MDAVLHMLAVLSVGSAYDISIFGSNLPKNSSFFFYLFISSCFFLVTTFALAGVGGSGIVALLCSHLLPPPLLRCMLMGAGRWVLYVAVAELLLLLQNTKPGKALNIMISRERQRRERQSYSFLNSYLWYT